MLCSNKNISEDDFKNTPVYKSEQNLSYHDTESLTLNKGQIMEDNSQQDNEAKLPTLLEELDHPEVGKLEESKSCAKHTVTVRRIYNTYNLDEEPERIYNCAELLLNLTKNSNIFVPLHKINKRKVGKKFSLDHVSMHLCASASGQILPPLIIFKDTLPNGTFAQDGPDDALYWVNPLGISDANCFLRWFTEIFLQYSKPTTEKPVLLLLNDSDVYQNPKLTKCAEKNNVILMLLKPNPKTKIYHPLEAGLYPALQKKLEFLSLIGETDNGLWISKDDLPSETGRLFQDTSLAAAIQLGFKKTGYFPYDSALLEVRNQLSSKMVTTKIDSLEDIDEEPDGNLASPRNSKKLDQKGLDAALSAIRNDHMHYKEAANEYGISLPVLIERLHYRVSTDVNGVVPLFPKNSQELLSIYICYMANIGYPLTINQALMTATCIDKCSSNSVLGIHSLPFDWWITFIKNYPKLLYLLEITSEDMYMERQLYSIMNDPKHYYLFVQSAMERNNLHLLPDNIYRCDQMLIDLRKDTNNSIRFLSSQMALKSDTDCISFTCCVSASGTLLPPLINFKGDAPIENYTETGPDDCTYGHSKTGILESSLFFTWFEQIFLNCVRPSPSKQIILFIEGFALYYSPLLIECAEANNILLISFCPNSTLTDFEHIEDALYFKFFEYLKYESQEGLATEDNLWINKSDIPAKIRNALNDSMSSNDIQSAFEKCGIYPFDSSLPHKGCTLSWFTETVKTTQTLSEQNGNSNEFEGFYENERGFLDNEMSPMDTGIVFSDEECGNTLPKKDSHILSYESAKMVNIRAQPKKKRLEEAFKLVNQGTPVVKAASYCKLGKTAVDSYMKQKRARCIPDQVKASDLKLPRKERLIKAVSLARSGVKVAKASRMFNIPTSTLSRHIKLIHAEQFQSPESKSGSRVTKTAKKPLQKTTTKIQARNRGKKYSVPKNPQLSVIDRLEMAANAVNSGISVLQSSVAYNVQTEALKNYINNKYLGDGKMPLSELNNDFNAYQKIFGEENNDVDSFNPFSDNADDSVLSESPLPEIEEADLVEYLQWMLSIGYPRSKENIPNFVKYILDKKNMVIFDDDNHPDSEWVRKFLLRYPVLSGELHDISTQDKSLPPRKFFEHFAKLENLLENEHLLNAREFLQPENGDRIFNCDQIDFNLSLEDRKSDAFLCNSASGLVMNPLLLSNGKRPFRSSVDLDTLDKFYYKESVIGHMNGELFLSWLEDCFDPYLNESDIEKPVVLLLNGSKIDLTLPSVLSAQEKGIILFCFPGCCTQPLFPYFKSLKEFYHESLTSNVTEIFQDKDESEFIPYLLLQAMEQVDRSSCADGFKEAQIVPYCIDTNFEELDNTSISKRLKNKRTCFSKRRKSLGKAHTTDPPNLGIKIKQEVLSDSEFDSHPVSQDNADFLGFETSVTKPLINCNKISDIKKSKTQGKRKRKRKKVDVLPADVQKSLRIERKEKLHYMVACYLESKESLKTFESFLDPETIDSYQTYFSTGVVCKEGLYQAWKALKQHLSDTTQKVDEYAMFGKVPEGISPFQHDDLSTLIQFSNL